MPFYKAIKELCENCRPITLSGQITVDALDMCGSLVLSNPVTHIMYYRCTCIVWMEFHINHPSLAFSVAQFTYLLLELGLQKIGHVGTNYTPSYNHISVL